MTVSKTQSGVPDPYWNDSATSVLAAIIALAREKAFEAKRKPSFADVVDMYRNMIVKERNGQHLRIGTSVSCAVQ